MRSVKSLLQDLVDGKAVPQQRTTPVAPYVPVPEQKAKPFEPQEPVTTYRKTPPPRHNDYVYVPPSTLKQTPQPAPVEIAASAICPDNNGKPHEVSISRGKSSCWLCGADLSSVRDASTSWRASVYGTKVKR